MPIKLYSLRQRQQRRRFYESDIEVGNESPGSDGKSATSNEQHSMTSIIESYLNSGLLLTKLVLLSFY